MVNKKGEIVIELRFDDACGFGENGLARVKIGEKWGYINEKGEIVIEPQFDATYGFAENGLAQVKVDKKYGWINEKGEFVIEPRFDYASDFYDDYARVSIGGLYGYIDKQGNLTMLLTVDCVND